MTIEEQGANALAEPQTSTSEASEGKDEPGESVDAAEDAAAAEEAGIGETKAAPPGEAGQELDETAKADTADSAAVSTATRSRKPRKGLRSRVLFSAFVGIAAVIGAVGFYAWSRFLSYDHEAIQHIPADAVTIGRLDLSQVAVYAPIREHVLAPLLKLRKQGARGESSPLDDLESKTGLRLRDLREIVVAQGLEAEDVVILIGGLFPKGKVLPGLKSWIESGDAILRGELELHGDIAHHMPDGLWIGQATDGTIVAASSEAYLRKALKGAPNKDTHGLQLNRPMELLLEDQGLSRLQALLQQMPMFSGLAKVTKLRAWVEIEETATVRVELGYPAGNEAKEVQKEVDTALKAARMLLAVLPQKEYGGERSLLTRVESAAKPPSSVQLSAHWEQSEVENAAKELGAFLLKRASSDNSEN